MIDELLIKHTIADGDTVFIIINAPDGPIYISVGELDYSKSPKVDVEALIRNFESNLDNVKTLMDVCCWKGLKTDRYGMVVGVE